LHQERAKNFLRIARRMRGSKLPAKAAIAEV
jgi:hypothetical protein